MIAGDVERAMEDAEDVDIPILFDEIGDSVMLVKQDAHMSRRYGVARAKCGNRRRS